MHAAHSVQQAPPSTAQGGGCPFIASMQTPTSALPGQTASEPSPANGTDSVPSPSAAAASMVSLYNVMDDLLEPMVVADHRATILRVNKATLRLFGYTEAELLGQNVSLLCEPTVAKVHHRYVERFLSTRLPVVIGTAGREVRGQHKSGTLMPLRLSMAETKQNGQSLFIAQLHDLRPIKTREEELRVFSQVNKTIVERTSAEIHERIMHSVAHELRNPLQTISGCLYLLKQSFTHLSSADVQLITEIDDSIRRCCRVLDNAVNVCNYQTRRLTLDPAYERTAVGDLLRAVETHLRAFTTAPLVVLVDDAVPETVYLNAKHTLQILKYAVANAIKFTIRGDLVIRCTMDPSGALLRFELDYVTLLGSRGPPVAPWLLPVTESSSSPSLRAASTPAPKFDLALAMSEPAHHVECDPQLLIPPSHPLPAHLRSALPSDLLRYGAANGCPVASSMFNASPASSFSAASHSAAAKSSTDFGESIASGQEFSASLNERESPHSGGESPLPNLRAISHTLPAPAAQPVQPRSAPALSSTTRSQSRRSLLLQLATGGSSDGSSSQSSPATEPADGAAQSPVAEGAGEGGDAEAHGRTESSVYSFTRAQSLRNGPGLSPTPLPAPCQHCVSSYAMAGLTDPNRIDINNLYSSNSRPDAVHRLLNQHAHSTIAVATVSVAPDRPSSGTQQTAPASMSVPSSELSTEHMWRVTGELVHAMGGKCGLEVVGCFDEELPNSDELALPHNSVQYIQASGAAKPLIEAQAAEGPKRPVIRSMKDLNIAIPEPSAHAHAGSSFLMTSNGISSINNAAIQAVLNSLTSSSSSSGSPSLPALSALATSASTPALPLDLAAPQDPAPRAPVTSTAASGNRSPPRRRIGHFTNKRYWFTVPFSINPRTVSAEDQKSAALNDELVKGHAIKVGGNEMPSGSVGVTSSTETYPKLLSSLTPSPSRLSLYSVELSDGSEPGSGTRAAMSPATNLRSLSACSSPMPVHSAAPVPATRVAVSAHSTQTSPSAANSPSALEEKLNKNILFVDDEPTIGKLASRFLQKLGCTFTVLKDGDQVAATMQNTPRKFDVVFLDIVMPKMSGEEACALVRQFDTTTPIIAATANTSAQDQLRYISVGFNGCLAKPYSIADMKAAILQHSTIPE